MTKVSYFSKVFDKKPQKDIEFNEYLDGIQSGTWQDKYLAYKSGKIEKRFLPAITVSGTFTARNSKSLINHSGFINIDIDAKDNPDSNLLDMRAELCADSFIYALHVSVSGKGLSAYIKINKAKHYESFLALEKYFANKYKLIIDKSGKDIPRLRFVSYDPEIYVNEKAEKWTEYIQKAKQEPRFFNDYIASESDFDFVMEQIISKKINIADDYSDWMKVGFAISSKYGESGRGYFHDVSKNSQKYDVAKCDKKYDNICKSRNVGVSIKSFFWMAKMANCEIKSPRTERILSVAKIRMKQVGKSGGVKSKQQAEIETKKFLREIDGIHGADVDEIIEQVKELPEKQLNEKTNLQQQLETIIQLVNQKKIRYNVITGKLEAENKELIDIEINSIYLDVIEVDKNIRRQLFDTVMNSNRIPNFDPFVEFIEKNKHLKPSGNIDKIMNAISDGMGENGHHYKNIFVRKWMLSIIASVYGTYSLMILVLTGKQMTEKTNWFRFLLPKEIRKYYAESKLDAGKDDEILMTQKLLVIDDEFAGKSKQEAKKLKDLSSKQVFSIRRPYGRMTEDIRRIAVLGGTSNDDDILNDPTGNRRIIPLKVLSIDRKLYDSIDKKELFIEMYHEWKNVGDGWMLSPEEVKILNEMTVLHEQDVAEFDLVQKYYEIDEFRNDKLSTTDVVIFLDTKVKRPLSIKKIGEGLNKLGYKKHPIKLNGKRKNIWNIRLIDGFRDYYVIQ